MSLLGLPDGISTAALDTGATIRRGVDRWARRPQDSTGPLAQRRAPDRELDLRGEVCPYTFLKARLALEEMDPGQVLRVVVDSPASARDVPRSLEQLGHEILTVVIGQPPESGAIVVRRV